VVASRLNMTPEHFSRVLHELSSAGLIEVDGRTVRIIDLEGLRGFGSCAPHSGEQAAQGWLARLANHAILGGLQEIRDADQHA